MDPDSVCPERLDPDPVNIRPDPKPWVGGEESQRTRVGYQGNGDFIEML